MVRSGVVSDARSSGPTNRTPVWVARSRAAAAASDRAESCRLGRPGPPGRDPARGRRGSSRSSRYEAPRPGWAMPALCRDCAPMMLRVRPAQLTHDKGRRVGCQRRDAMHQLASRHTGRAGGCSWWCTRRSGGHRPRPDPCRPGGGRQPPLGGHRGRGADRIDQLAERLARNVDVDEHLTAAGDPGRPAHPRGG